MNGENRCDYSIDVYCIQDVLLNDINHSHQTLIWVGIWDNTSRNGLKPLDIVSTDA